MKRYAPFHPDHEFLGRTLVNVQEALGSDMVDIHEYFKRHGLTDVDPDAWYPAQKWFDVMNDIAADGLPLLDFTGIGMKSVENAIIPPELRAMPLAQFLQNAAKTYALHNRGTDIGDQYCEVVSERHVSMILRMPHPDDFWYGVFFGLVRSFLPLETRFRVCYDEETPRREDGGQYTIIHIEWE